MNEVEVLKRTLSRQANRIANLTMDLDLAYAQIEMLNEQLNKTEEKED